MFYKGAARRITDYEISSLAKDAEIEEAALRAVIEIEARGTGFHSSGALVCLYEPHIAYKQTSGPIRNELVNAGLAYAKWGMKPYPKSSFQRIDKCAKIAGEEVACLSTSWGMPQMMGFNHKVCGYSTALEMVKSFAQSEYNQIKAMIRFIKDNPKMYTALKKGHWATFASLYNGIGYKKNKYDTKLSNAYAKWAKKLAGRTPPKKPEPAGEKEDTVSNATGVGIAAVILAGVTGIVAWFASLPCSLFGIFCGG